MNSILSRCFVRIPEICHKALTLTRYDTNSRFLCQGKTKFFSSTSSRTLQKEKGKGSTETDIDIAREKPFAHLTFKEKVKEAGKTSFWGGIIVIGVGVTGFVSYVILREVFSSQSPRGIQSKSFDLCRENTELMDILGEPVKCYGEETSRRRGRRRHTSHVEYEADGKQHLKMVFYIEGKHRKGTVHLEVQKSPGEKYAYRYLFVEINGYPPRTIILQDNR